MSLYSRFVTSNRLKTRYVIAVVLFVIVSSGFASLADEVRDGDTLPIDRYILTAIYSGLSSPTMDAIVSAGTYAGGVPFIVTVTVGLLAYLTYRKAYSKALFLGLVMAGTACANIVLKLFFERQRPDLWQQIVEEVTFSFPSGHAMGSMAIGLSIITLTWNTKWRTLIVLATTTYIIFIGFTRLYLGVHYPSDILAGWILSAGWVALLIILLRVSDRLEQQESLQN